MTDEVKGMRLEMGTQDSVRFGVMLVGVSVVWGLVVAALPPGFRTGPVIATFMIPILVAWELGVITTYTLLQYRERVFGRLVDASTNLAAGVVLAIVDFTLVGFFFLFQETFQTAVPGGPEPFFLVVILVGVAGYWFTYRSVRQLMATAT